MDVVLFVNQRCSMWNGRQSPTDDGCLFGLHIFLSLLQLPVQCFHMILYCWTRAKKCLCFMKELKLYILCLHFIRYVCNCHFQHWKPWTVLKSRNTFSNFCFQDFFLASWLQWWWCWSTIWIRRYGLMKGISPTVAISFLFNVVPPAGGNF